MSVLSHIAPKAKPQERGTGGRHTPVSVALRWLSKTRQVFVVTISRETALEALGVDTKTQKNVFAEIGVEETTGTLVLANVSALHSDPENLPPGVWTGNNRQGTLVFALPPRWIGEERLKEKRPAQRVEFGAVVKAIHDHRVFDIRFLEITLPDWAAPMRRGTALAQEAADKARERAGLPPIRKVG